MERRLAANGVAIYISRVLERAGVPHAFSTRIGGISTGIFSSLNLGNPSGCAEQDAGDTIEENYRLFQQSIGCENFPRCRAHQVHGAGILHLHRNELFENGQKADAIVGDDPARVAAVRIADCVPVLLATEDGRTVAAVHSGWRGVIAGIVPKTIDALQTRSENPRASILAAIGPSISIDAFEVGSEVLAEFANAFGSLAPLRRRDDGKGHVDLRASIRLQLQQCGLTDEQIDISDRCTWRDSDEFFSHRRERGITGRMAAIIAARP